MLICLGKHLCILFFEHLFYFLMFFFFLFCFIVALLSSGVAGAYSIGTIYELKSVYIILKNEIMFFIFNYVYFIEATFFTYFITKN
jgi:hypothetical protein